MGASFGYHASHKIFRTISHFLFLDISPFRRSLSMVARGNYYLYLQQLYYCPVHAWSKLALLSAHEGIENVVTSARYCLIV